MEANGTECTEETKQEGTRTEASTESQTSEVDVSVIDLDMKWNYIIEELLLNICSISFITINLSFICIWSKSKDYLPQIPGKLVKDFQCTAEDSTRFDIYLLRYSTLKLTKNFKVE